MISVIMPIYNAAAFLRDAIESILNQTETDFELILVNDGSKDNSEEIILSYQDPRIVYVKQENQGEAAARNHGLDIARGAFVAWLDADDISLPNRLEVLRRHFTAPEIGYVHSDMMLINEHNEPIGYWQSRQIEREHLLRFFLKVGTPFNNPSMMIRREAIGDRRYNRAFKVGTDADMVFRFAPYWEGVHVPEPLVLYRRHSNNLSNTQDYQVLAAHLKAFIASHPLETLIPEVDWQSDSAEDARGIAMAILATLLFRRGLHPEAQDWYDLAASTVQGEEARKLVIGLGQLLMGNIEQAFSQLFGIRHHNHIVENYLGEAYAYLGDKNQASVHFQRALAKAPHYEEPLSNLKAIGAGQGLNLIDNQWAKFRR